MGCGRRSWTPTVVGFARVPWTHARVLALAWPKPSSPPSRLAAGSVAGSGRHFPAHLRGEGAGGEEAASGSRRELRLGVGRGLLCWELSSGSHQRGGREGAAFSGPHTLAGPAGTQPAGPQPPFAHPGVPAVPCLPLGSPRPGLPSALALGSPCPSLAEPGGCSGAAVHASPRALDMGLEKPTHPLLCSPAPQPSSPPCFPSLWRLGIVIAKPGGTRRGGAPSCLTPCVSRSLANIPLTPETQRDQERRIRREIANSNERRRMQSINAGFQSLKTLIPHTDGEKLSKVSGTSPRPRWCGVQTLVLHMEVFVIACRAGRGCESNWGCLHILIHRWRSLLGRFPRWECVCIGNPVSWRGLDTCESTPCRGSRVVCV